MTRHRELATAIARKIFDRIERDRTLILQNVADEIHDALVLDAAKPKVIAKGEVVKKNAQTFWWLVEPEAGE